MGLSFGRAIVRQTIFDFLGRPFFLLNISQRVSIEFSYRSISRPLASIQNSQNFLRERGRRVPISNSFPMISFSMQGKLSYSSSPVSLVPLFIQSVFHFVLLLDIKCTFENTTKNWPMTASTIFTNGRTRTKNDVSKMLTLQHFTKMSKWVFLLEIFKIEKKNPSFFVVDLRFSRS